MELEFDFDDDVFQSKCAVGKVVNNNDHPSCANSTHNPDGNLQFSGHTPNDPPRFEAKNESPAWFCDQLRRDQLDLTTASVGEVGQYVSQNPDRRDWIRLAGNYHYSRRNFGVALAAYRAIAPLINPAKERTFKLEVQETVVRCCIRLTTDGPRSADPCSAEDWTSGFGELIRYIHEGWNVDHEIVACSLVNDFVKAYGLSNWKRYQEISVATGGDSRGSRTETTADVPTVVWENLSWEDPSSLALAAYRSTALARLIGYSDKNPDIWIDFGDALTDFSQLFEKFCDYNNCDPTSLTMPSMMLSDLCDRLQIDRELLTEKSANKRRILSEIDSACSHLCQLSIRLKHRLPLAAHCCWIRARSILETHLNDPEVSDWISTIYRQKLSHLNSHKIHDSLEFCRGYDVEYSVVMDRMTGDLRFRDRLADDSSAIAGTPTVGGSTPGEGFSYRSDESSTEKLGGNPGLIFKLQWDESVRKCFNRWFESIF